MPYIKAIHQEWDIYKTRLKRNRIPVSEIHIGGGTPTFMSPEELKLLLEPMLADMDLSANAELSFEADPRVMAFRITIPPFKKPSTASNQSNW